MKTEADVSRVDQDRLEQIALQLYSQAVAQRFAIDDEMARKCFVEANRFLRVAAGVRDGSIAAEPAGPPPFEMVKTPIWNLLSDDEDGAQKWAHLENENGEKQFSSHPRDFFSFAPNLSPEHPINKRGHPEAARLILESSQDKAAHAEQKKANDLRMRKLALAAN